MPLPLQGKPPPSRWVKPGSAGAGYASKKLRVPKWEPKWDMPGSTVVSSLQPACSTLSGPLPTVLGSERPPLLWPAQAMPCNYSGYYDIASLKGFGYLQFDCARTARTQLSCSPHAGAACAGTHLAPAESLLPSAGQGRTGRTSGARPSR